MLSQLISIVEQAGEILLSAQQSESNISEKNGIGNFVTTYDIKIQQFLQEKLCAAFPETYFIGEESEVHANVKNGLAFIVDPIDCTANFMRGMHHSAISVGLAEHGQMIAGVVYNPYRKETFYAQKGKGAFCNQKAIHVSNRSLEQGIFSFGTSPYSKSLRQQTMQISQRLMNHMQDLRRFGSAALDLCYIACGYLDLGFECILQPWDYAAGSLILTEAGGKITQFDGSPITLDCPCSIVSGNPYAHQQALEAKIFE